MAVCDGHLVKIAHAGVATHCDESVGLSYRGVGGKALDHAAKQQ